MAIVRVRYIVEDEWDTENEPVFRDQVKQDAEDMRRDIQRDHLCSATIESIVIDGVQLPNA